MAIGDDFNGPGRSEPAPARHHEPFQKTFFFEKGSWCRRAAAGRAAGGAAQHAAKGGTGRPPGGLQTSLGKNVPDSTVFCVQALNPPSEAEM